MVYRPVHSSCPPITWRFTPDILDWSGLIISFMVSRYLSLLQSFSDSTIAPPLTPHTPFGKVNYCYYDIEHVNACDFVPPVLTKGAHHLRIYMRHWGTRRRRVRMRWYIAKTVTVFWGMDFPLVTNTHMYTLNLEVHYTWPLIIKLFAISFTARYFNLNLIKFAIVKSYISS